MKESVPKKVLAQYDIGAVKKANLVSSGLIHQTWKVRAGKGDLPAGRQDFILQRLHPILATPEIAEDFFVVTTFLNDEGVLAPKCVLTRKQTVLADDRERVWRMQTYIPGKTFHRLEKPAMAAEAGRIFARFHMTLDRLPYRFKSKKMLHDTEKILAAFKKTAATNKKSELYQPVASDVQFVLRELPKLFLPKGLPMRCIHGDPKISNILFHADGEALAIVDLDTCNRRPILVEFGDAFRSWCGLKEDDPKNRFRLPVFKAAWKGYSDEAGKFLTKKEISLIPQSIGTITLELASRFLKDYFEDSYFGWDANRYPNRRAHNLARARGQIALYRDLKKKLPTVRSVIARRLS